MTSLLKRVLPFLITLILGTGMWNVFGFKKTENGAGRGNYRCKHERIIAGESTPLRILPQSDAPYTLEGQDKRATGVVRLLVRFNPNGTTTVIERLSSTLPKSLTEEAIHIAWQTRFIPATLNGQPVAETRVMRYAFNKGDNLNYVFNVSDDEIKTKEP